MCNYQRLLQLLIIIFTSFFTQKHLNYHLKGTTSERSAELYGEGNERQLMVLMSTFITIVLWGMDLPLPLLISIYLMMNC